MAKQCLLGQLFIIYSVVTGNTTIPNKEIIIKIQNGRLKKVKMFPLEISGLIITVTYIRTLF